jgi:lambda family phage tail tape measure protein
MANLDALLRIKTDVQGANGIVSLNRQLQGVERTAAGASVAMRGMAGSSALLTSSLGALAPLLSAAGLVGLVKGAIDAGDAMNDLSQRTGVSVDALAKFKKAAATSGTDIDAVAKSLGRLSKGMFEAGTTGKGKAADALNALGISATDAAGKLKTADAVTLEIADRFKAMPDGVTKTALAMALFGRSGAEMIPMLNEGGKAIDALSVKMTAAFAKKADEYSDKLAILSGKVGALGMDLAIALLPALTAVTDAVTAGVTAFGSMPGPLKSATLSAAALALAWGPLTSVVKGSIAVMALFSTSTATAGAAATAATPRVVALRSALGGLLKFGLITLGINVVISGMSKLVELQARLDKVTSRGTNEYFSDIGGNAASKEKLQTELINVRKQIQALKKEASSVRFPLLTGQDEAANAALLVARTREAKLLAQIAKARPQALIPSTASGYAPDLSGYAGGGGAGGGASKPSQAEVNARALLATIRFAEGTIGPNGYGTHFGGGYTPPGGPHPNRVVRAGGYASAAYGAYQFMPDTWRGTGGGNMTPARQDAAALRLIRNRGVDPGQSLNRGMIDKLAPEWASLPTLKTGTSYYGQGGKSFSQLQDFYRQQVARGGGDVGGLDLAFGQDNAQAKEQAAAEAKRKDEEDKRRKEQIARQLSSARDLLTSNEAALRVAEATTPLGKLGAEYDQQRARRMREYADLLRAALSDEERRALITSQQKAIGVAEVAYKKELKQLTEDQLKTEQERATLAIDAERERAQALQESLSYMQELSSRDSIGAGFQQGIQSYVDSIGNMRDAVGQLTTDTIGGLSNALGELATTGTAKYREFAVSILKDTGAMIMKQLVLKTIMSVIGGIGGGAGKAFEMPGAGFLPTGGFGGPLQSFAGGGYTGRGTRSGGMDGQGGFMAMLHPHETVTDHMRSGPGLIMPLRRGRNGVAAAYPAIPGIPSGGAGGGMDGSPDVLGAAGGAMPGSSSSSTSRFERTDAVLTRMVEAAKQGSIATAAAAVAAGGGGTTRVQLEVSKINNVEYITLEQAQGIANAAANRSTARERRSLQGSPAARRGVGI